MANEEARAMLDALMGGDRNAPLPPGAAVPRKRKHGDDENNNNNNNASSSSYSKSTTLLLPGKRRKSCFDKDIDPLYTAWGVDVYDLFVNTKSDLGTNPYVVDEGAHEQYRQLSLPEREATGYEYFLFHKLQELVRQCDRTVQRNQAKLQQELSRKSHVGGGGVDAFVEHVDEQQVEALVRAMCQAQDLKEEWENAMLQLDPIVQQEAAAKKQLEALLQARRQQAEQQQQEQEPKQELTSGGDGGKESDNGTGDANQMKADQVPVKQEEEEQQGGAPEASSSSQNQDDTDTRTLETNLQLQLGQLTLQKQRLVFDIGRCMTRLVPLLDSISSQHRNLNYVKSDISTDKTVCHVSGNFMSSRDADERIAAHYAGKQYVGWKLVRDKLDQMVQQYGRHGPPPPAVRVAPTGGGPSMGMTASSSSRGGGGGGGHGQRRGSGGSDHRSGGGASSIGGGSGHDRGGGGGRYNSNDDGYRGGGGGPGRWERHGPSGGGGGGYQDRGRGGPPSGRDGNNWRR